MTLHNRHTCNTTALRNSSPQSKSTFSFFFSSYHDITCSNLQFCFNLIIVPYPVGWPQHHSCDACVLYNTPLLSSPLLSSSLSLSLSLSLSSPLPSSTSVCLCWWCVKTLQPASPAPLAAVKSNISALSPLQRHKTRFESIKNAGLFGLLVLINID